MLKALSKTLFLYLIHALHPILSVTLLCQTVFDWLTCLKDLTVYGVNPSLIESVEQTSVVHMCKALWNFCVKKKKSMI